MRCPLTSVSSVQAHGPPPRVEEKLHVVAAVHELAAQEHVSHIT